MGFVIIMSTSCEMPEVEMAKYWQKISTKITITKYDQANLMVQDKNE